MGILIGLEHVAHEWPNKKVLDDLTIGVHEGERIGVVGRNGDGKSTLLEIIGRRLDPDSARSRTGAASMSAGSARRTTFATTTRFAVPSSEISQSTFGRAIPASARSSMSLSATLIGEVLWASSPAASVAAATSRGFLWEPGTSFSWTSPRTTSTCRRFSGLPTT